MTIRELLYLIGAIEDINLDAPITGVVDGLYTCRVEYRENKLVFYLDAQDDE